MQVRTLSVVTGPTAAMAATHSASPAKTCTSSLRKCASNKACSGRDGANVIVCAVNRLMR